MKVHSNASLEETDGQSEREIQEVQACLAEAITNNLGRAVTNYPVR